jgi:siderophore synthetase component
MIKVEKIAYLLKQAEHKDIRSEMKCMITRTTHPLNKARVRISEIH